MLRSIEVILLSVVFSISTLDGRHLDMEGTMDGKPEDQSGYVRLHEVDDLEKSWINFKKEHGKTYKNSSEEKDRKKIFEENLKEIALHNERYAKGEETYEQGMNQFGDLTDAEFVKMISCRPKLNASTEEQDKTIGIPKEIVGRGRAPSAVDWRPTGAVTRVKNQGNCGSCWAFGAVGSLEGQMYLRSTTESSAVTLSEQNLVDCSKRNGGCWGGFSLYAFLDIRDQGGIDTEDTYQYEAQGTCRYSPRTRGARVHDVVTLPRGSEFMLELAVAYVGPIGVAIDASGLHFYKSGIYSDYRCRNSFYALNHEVLVVGYKSAGPGRDYWIVKNSWDTTYGMDGYVLMSRNKGNQCGIATDAVIPEVY